MLATIGGHYWRLVCVSVCGIVCHGRGKRNLGWSFEEMKSNTLLIDVIEGNWLKLSSTALLFLLRGHHIYLRHCNICVAQLLSGTERVHVRSGH